MLTSPYSAADASGLLAPRFQKLASPSGTPQCVLKPLEVFSQEFRIHSKRAHEGLNYATPHVRSEPRGLCLVLCYG